MCKSATWWCSLMSQRCGINGGTTDEACQKVSSHLTVHDIILLKHWDDKKPSSSNRPLLAVHHANVCLGSSSMDVNCANTILYSLTKKFGWENLWDISIMSHLIIIRELSHKSEDKKVTITVVAIWLILQCWLVVSLCFNTLGDVNCNVDGIIISMSTLWRHFSSLSKHTC